VWERKRPSVAFGVLGGVSQSNMAGEVKQRK
jgi:hypothetical protein